MWFYDPILQNSGYETNAIYLDFAKAFDKVYHQIIIQKTPSYSIIGSMFKSIKTFLSDRTPLSNPEVKFMLLCYTQTRCPVELRRQPRLASTVQIFNRSMVKYCCSKYKRHPKIKYLRRHDRCIIIIPV